MDIIVNGQPKTLTTTSVSYADIMILKEGIYELTENGWKWIENVTLIYQGYFVGRRGQPPFGRHEVTDKTIILTSVKESGGGE